MMDRVFLKVLSVKRPGRKGVRVRGNDYGSNITNSEIATMSRE
jgi:hypothetical protein